MYVICNLEGVLTDVLSGNLIIGTLIMGFVGMYMLMTSGRILGIHIVGPHASELIAEATTLLNFGASVHDVAATCHAHPTLAEALKEASLAVNKEAIHG